MSRIEISGYVQIAVGIVGIILTVLTAPAMLDALSQIGGPSALPVEFRGIGGAIRIFSVLFVLFAMVLLVVLGMTITLSTLFKLLGASTPLVSSFAAVLSIICLAVVVTLGAMGSTLWVPGFVGTLGLALIAVAGWTKDEDHQTKMTVAVVFLCLFLLTGFGERVVAGTPPIASASQANGS